MGVGCALHHACLLPDGQVLFSTTGSVDMLELRRKILASVPAAYIGFQKYWVEN